MLASGTRLGHYTVTGLIGAGGMGTVYEAMDERLHRRVAIKVLPPRLAVDAESLQRFRQEARAASALNHPNIVHIYAIDDAEVDGDRVPYIVMELVEGTTLRSRMTRNANPSDLLEALTQVAEAMARAHERGIVHRDLKPENIMIHRDGYAKVVDFGLAKLLGPRAIPGAADAATEPLLSADGSVRGTAAYMSPEQVRGEDADERSDVFTLGCILYEIASGRRPFEAGTLVDTLWNIVHSQATPLREIDPGIPMEWERITARCMEKNPADRYPSARSLAADLRELLRSRTVPVERRTSARRSWFRRAEARRATAIAIVVIVLIAIAFVAWRALHQTRDITSVAVLPFRNVRTDPELDYISDGVTESLISGLSEMTSMRVMSRASVFRFKDGNVAPIEAGRALKVDAVVVGDVESRGHRLSIRTELIDVSDGARLWGERYDADAASILGVQEAISRAVAAKLRPEQRAQPQRSSTEDPEAYRLYLKGRYHWNKRSADGLTRAASHFREALERDASYARAWVGLADSYALMEQYAGVPSRETCPKAKAAALRAIEIDPSLAEPHATLGLLYAHCEWNWPGSEREFRRAIELNPNYATTHHWYALHLAYRGELTRALAEARRAQELDPLSLIANNALAVVHAYARDYDAVLDQCRKNLEMDPNFVVTYMWIGRARRAQGKHDEAIAALQKAVELSQGKSKEALSDLGFAFAIAGRREDALEILNRLEGESAHYPRATIYAGLGDHDRALEALDRAMEAHSWFLVQLGVDPPFDSLRTDPRFEQIRRRVISAAR